MNSKLKKIELAAGCDGLGCPQCRIAPVETQYAVGFAGDDLIEPADCVCEHCGRVIAEGKAYHVRFGNNLPGAGDDPMVTEV
ncbi:MAG TPA: hypothetical protein PKY77_25885 [Phycisphaerae bacterium]|nr:hypothetical protein [Phycisphaerae bacterium]HRY66851.1 hypothetical protein [Phycisphaerae bacterium]HSA26909.1 hypothetical protein [Phycisphaerae bacterium]